MKTLLVMMLLLYPLTAAAETYEWTDESGIVNFTEDLGKVPKKYRKKARLVGEESDVTQGTDLAPPPAPAPAEKGKGEGAQKGNTLYGGKDENTWRRDFLNAKFDLQQSQADLEELQGRLRDTSKMSRSEYLTIQNSIKHAEKRLQQRQKKMEQLKELADRADVPADFRQ